MEEDNGLVFLILLLGILPEVISCIHALLFYWTKLAD